MPRKDGTGPMGKGAGTGRGLGNCTHFCRITTCCNYCSGLLLSGFRKRRNKLIRRNGKL